MICDDFCYLFYFFFYSENESKKSFIKYVVTENEELKQKKEE